MVHWNPPTTPSSPSLFSHQSHRAADDSLLFQRISHSTYRKARYWRGTRAAAITTDTHFHGITDAYFLTTPLPASYANAVSESRRAASPSDGPRSFPTRANLAITFSQILLDSNPRSFLSLESKIAIIQHPLHPRYTMRIQCKKGLDRESFESR